MEKYGAARQATDENIAQRMRFACWITKVTDTHTHTHTHTHTLKMCNTYSFTTATMVMRTRPNVTLYVHCVSHYVQS
jgi:hypothetical protein